MAKKKVASKKTRKKAPTRAPKKYSGGEFRSSGTVKNALIDGITFTRKPVSYSEVDGLAIFEGDIVLGAVDQVDRVTAMRQAESATGLGPVVAGVVISGDQYRWPNATVPYEIDPNLSNQQRVHDAIAHWEANTPIRLIQRTTETDFVRFVPGGGCSSYVGRRGGQQNITLGAGCTTGSTIHEIGHAVGLWHEQSREDRDAFVTIHFENIEAGREHNFSQHINDGDDVGAYDFDSIMHYPRWAFSRNGQDTIVPTDPNAQIGQRNGLSQQDIATIEAIYPDVPPPLETGALHRYWNPGIGDHFYTANWNELGNGRHGYVYEGVQAYVHTTQEHDAVPLYRYWNASAGDHFYTTDWAELGNGRYGWAYEGVAGYVHDRRASGTIPLYRYWNPHLADHFYTTNWTELRGGRHGWTFERIECYVYAQARNADVPSPDASSDRPATFTLAGVPRGSADDAPSSFQTGTASDAGHAETPSTFTASSRSGSGAPSSFSTDAGPRSSGVTVNINVDKP